MRDNPLQFAVVREDPAIEDAIVRARRARRALLVASGGCTALHLAARHPTLALTLFDLNPHQLAHCDEKRATLALPDEATRQAAFNVGTDEPSGLSERGNFESLFRGLRSLLADLAGSPELLARACDGERDAVEALRSSRYWPVAFELFFSDALLFAMFGPEAVQHAPSGSYPRYFQAIFERGLARADARDNYFLHHALLGRYSERVEAWPEYLRVAPRTLPPWEAIHGTLEQVPDLDTYDLVSLSNLFDWMSPREVEASCRHLAARLAPGATIVIRQLNSTLDLRPLLAPRFDLDDAWALEQCERDRSLFYARLSIGRAR